MAAKLQPLGDRLVVKPIEKEEKTKWAFTCRIQPKKNPRRGKSSLSAREI